MDGLKTVHVTEKQMEVIREIHAGRRTTTDIHMNTDMTYKQVYTILKALMKRKAIQIRDRKYYSLPLGMSYTCIIVTENGSKEERLDTDPIRERPPAFKGGLTVTKITPEEYDDMYTKAMAKHRLFVNKNGSMFLNPYYKANR